MRPTVGTIAAQRYGRRASLRQSPYGRQSGWRYRRGPSQPQVLGDPDSFVEQVEHIVQTFGYAIVEESQRTALDAGRDELLQEMLGLGLQLDQVLAPVVKHQALLPRLGRVLYPCLGRQRQRVTPAQQLL